MKKRAKEKRDMKPGQPRPSTCKLCGRPFDNRGSVLVYDGQGRHAHICPSCAE